MPLGVKATLTDEGDGGLLSEPLEISSSVTTETLGRHLEEKERRAKEIFKKSPR